MFLVKRVLAAEPSVVLGVLAAVVTGVVQEVPAGSHLSWSAVAPLVLAVVVRQFTFAPASVAKVRPGVNDAPANAAQALR